MIGLMKPHSILRTTQNTKHRYPFAAFFLLNLAISLGILVIFFFKRSLNLDEGWYLLAAKLVKQGQRPYIDFSYTQGPVLPYVYALFFSLFPVNLIAGRGITLLFAAVTWIITILTSSRLFGKHAALLVVWMLAAGWLAAGQYTYIATYALTGLFLSSGIFFWMASQWRWRYDAAALLLSLAAGVRIAVLPVLLIFYLALFFDHKRNWRQRLGTVLLSILTLAVLFAPFILQAPDQVWYNLVGFHTDRVMMTDRIRQWKQVIRSDIVMLLPFWLLMITSLWTKRSWLRKPWGKQQWLLLIILSLFGVHLIPRTADTYYNALQYPLMVVLMGGWLEPILYNKTHWLHKLLAGLVLCIAFIASQAIAVQHYQIIRFHNTPFADISRWRTFLANDVSDNCKQQSVTFTPILAIAGQTPIASGFEMGIFSYRPTWKTKPSKHFHAINNPVLAQWLLQPQTGWAAFSDYDLNNLLYGDLQEVHQILRDNYRLIATFPRLGAAESTVNLFLRPGCFQGKPAHVTNAIWQNGIELKGISWKQDKQYDEIIFFWRTSHSINTDYTVFFHILNEEGRLVYGYDEQPCRGTCPTSFWQTGELLRDEHRLEMPDLPPENYLLEIGLYDKQTQRLPLKNGNTALMLPFSVITDEFSP